MSGTKQRVCYAGLRATNGRLRTLTDAPYFSVSASFDYNVGMSTLEEIKTAIEKLSPAERAELDAYLQQADDAWDRQIAADARAGKLDRLLARVDANIDSGNLREFP